MRCEFESFFEPIMFDDVIALSQNFKILREPFYKRIIHLKVPSSFDFHLFINIGTWNANLNSLNPFLRWCRHHEGQNFIILRQWFQKRFVGLLEGPKIQTLLEYTPIFLKVVHLFTKAFIYAVNNCPLHHDLLEHARFLNFFNRKYSFDDVMALIYRLSPHALFSKNEICEMEQFLLLQWFDLSVFDD